MTESSALARVQRVIHFQRFGATKGIAGALTAASIIVPAELMLRTLLRTRRAHLPIVFHRGLACALGIHILCHGQPARRARVLFVANHVSWADIPVLGARIRAAFVAKSEVGGWGMVGWLATLARTCKSEYPKRSNMSVACDKLHMTM